MKLDFVKATDKDFDFLFNLRLKTMVSHLEKAGLYLTREQQYERVTYEYKCSHLIRVCGSLIGLLKFKENEKTIEIMQLQILPEFQGKGYGKSVIKHVIAIAGSKDISLTVLKNNPAYRLYTRLGFATVDEDKYEYHLQYKF